MYAALEAWGLERNAFKHGFPIQPDDPKIVAAAEANPGAVLRRPIGSKDEFKEDAGLPKASAARAAAPLPKIAKPAKRPAAREDKAKPDASVIRLDAVRRAREELKAKQRAREEAQQAKERARAEAEAERARAQGPRATEKAADALSAARSRHADAVAEIDQQRSALDALEEKEKRRWDGERKRLESALADAKKPSGE